MKRSLALATLALVGGLVAGCTDKADGIPQAGGSTTTKSSGSSSPTSSGSTPPSSGSDTGTSDSPLKNTEPCALLTPAEITSLNAGDPVTAQLGNGRSCRFPNAKGFVISVSIFDNAGLGEIAATGPITPIANIGKHKAVQNMRGSVCAISMEVTDSSRVDAQGTDDSRDDKKSCDLAMNLAKLVEPHLP